MPALGPYSKEIVLAKPDGRTREGRLLRQIRKNLVEQCGGVEKVTAAQVALIERAAMLGLRCAKLDARLVAGTFTILDNNCYIAWANAFRRSLIGLGLAEGEPGSRIRGEKRAAKDDAFASLYEHFREDAA